MEITIISNLNNFFIFRHKLKGTNFSFFDTNLFLTNEENFYNYFLFSKEDKTYIYFVKQLNIQTFNTFLSFKKENFEYIIIYEKITSECNKHEEINKTIFFFNKTFFLNYIYDNELSKKSFPVKILNIDEQNNLKKIFCSKTLNELQKMKLTQNLTIIGIRINDVVKFIRTENNIKTIIYKKII